MTLTWTKPSSAGSSAIVEYAVQTTTDGTIWSAPAMTGSPSSRFVVTGLANGQRYAFRVAAANESAVGQYSNPSAWVTTAGNAATPGQPRHLVIRLKAGGQAEVTWDAPRVNAGLTGYQWRVRISGGAWQNWKVVSTDPYQRSLWLSELRRGAAYTLHVRAMTGAGAGQPAAATFVAR